MDYLAHGWITGIRDSMYRAQPQQWIGGLDTVRLSACSDNWTPTTVPHPQAGCIRVTRVASTSPINFAFTKLEAKVGVAGGGGRRGCTLQYTVIVSASAGSVSLVVLVQFFLLYHT